MYKDQINKIRYLNYNINMLNDEIAIKGNRKFFPIVLNSESGIQI
jgi:hypothetical protein